MIIYLVYSVICPPWEDVMKHQPVSIHTEYIQIDQLLKLEGVIETGGQVKGLIDDQVLTLNGTIITEKRKKCRVGDVIGIDGLDVEFIVTKEEA